MTLTFRRVVTGQDLEGKSTLVSDERVAEGALGNFNFCGTAAVTESADIQVVATDVPFFPAAGETLFRIFRLPPADPDASPETLAKIAEAFFAGAGSSAKVDTSRHPLMHTTPTIDYIMLLSGEASLLLDKGDSIKLKPFDAVIQRGANHAWVVTGREPAVFVAVMVGKAGPISRDGSPAP